jgi:hypothetical protein
VAIAEYSCELRLSEWFYRDEVSGMILSDDRRDERSSGTAALPHPW